MRAGGVLLLILLTAVYYTLFVPFAVIYRCVSDPLRLSQKRAGLRGGFFMTRKRAAETRVTASQPF